MLYRENGQFKTSYRADNADLPDRARTAIAIGLILLAFAFVIVPAFDLQRIPASARS